MRQANNIGKWIGGRSIELATQALTTPNSESHESIRIEPTDFHVDWRPEPDDQGVVGSASASRIDLGALARLAEHVPFDARSRQLLTDYAPRGLVSGLTARWKGNAERRKHVVEEFASLEIGRASCRERV